MGIRKILVCIPPFIIIVFQIPTMKKITLFSLIVLFSCGQIRQNEAKNDSTTQAVIPPVVNNDRISGDFDGDGQKEFAFPVKVKQGHGNPVEDGEADEYAISFSNKNIKPINIGCCEARLVNENDLNNDGADDISVFQAPMNGNLYTLTTFTFAGKDHWRTLIEPFLVPASGGELSDDALQARVFLENDTIYFLDTDMNDENMGLLKQKAMLK